MIFLNVFLRKIVVLGITEETPEIQAVRLAENLGIEYFFCVLITNPKKL